MEIKKGAIPSDKLEMIRPRKVVAAVFSKHNLDLWLTSGKDGTHGVGTLHYAGYAEDYDSSVEISDELGKVLEKEVQETLYDVRYDIIWHKGHLHIEFDPSSFGKYK